MTFDEALTQINEQASFISVKNIWQKLRLRVLLRQYGITPSWMDHSWQKYGITPSWMDHRKNLCLIYFYATNEYQFISISPQALEKMGFCEIPFDSIATASISFNYDELL